MDLPGKEFVCPNCGMTVLEEDPYCRNCGYRRRRNYLVNLILLGVAIIPASMAACSVASIANALTYKPNDPSAQGAAIVAWFSMGVGPIALGILLGLVHWRFAECYRSRTDLRSLLPTVVLLGIGCVLSAGVWCWTIAAGWPHFGQLLFPLAGAVLSVIIVADMLNFLLKDRARRLREFDANVEDAGG